MHFDTIHETESGHIIVAYPAAYAPPVRYAVLRHIGGNTFDTISEHATRTAAYTALLLAALSIN